MGGLVSTVQTVDSLIGTISPAESSSNGNCGHCVLWLWIAHSNNSAVSGNYVKFVNSIPLMILVTFEFRYLKLNLTGRSKNIFISILFLFV